MVPGKGNFHDKAEQSGISCENAVAILANPAYDQVTEAWDSLNAAHDEFLDATEVEVIETAFLEWSLMVASSVTASNIS